MDSGTRQNLSGYFTKEDNSAIKFRLRKQGRNLKMGGLQMGILLITAPTKFGGIAEE